MQDVAPVLACRVPAEQLAHAEALVVPKYWPAAQALQTLLPEVEEVPAGQLFKHADAPDMAR